MGGVSGTWLYWTYRYFRWIEHARYQRQITPVSNPSNPRLEGFSVVREHRELRTVGTSATCRADSTSGNPSSRGFAPTPLPEFR